MSGTVMAVGAAGACALLALGLAVTGAASAAGQRVAGAADGAAIAGADTAAGAVSGIPCDRAAQVAQANGALLVGCAQDDLVVTVTVAVVFARIEVRASARAGPP